jgi:phthiodiolone/phenolphthiodiolone dimycocerosates ketoreductase
MSNIENPVSFTGDYYSLKEAWIDQRPKQIPYPPICIGAFGSKRMLNLIGRVGDGWFPFCTTSDDYRKKLGTIYNIAKEANRNPRSIEAASGIFIVVSTDQEIIERGINTLKAYTATTGHRLLKSEGVSLPYVIDYQNMKLSKNILEEIKKLAEFVPTSIIKK